MRQTGRVPLLRIALAQVNTTVGDLAGNAATVLARTREAVAAGATVVTFPELMLTGYPPEDLVHRPSFRAASRARWTSLRRSRCGRPGRRRGDRRVHRRATTARATRLPCCIEGRVAATYYKHHLPNYGVFDEERYFEPGDGSWRCACSGPTSA